MLPFCGYADEVASPSTEQHYSEAIELFTQAIRLNPRESVFFGNRAMARMKLEEYGGAVADTSKFKGRRDNCL